MKKTVIVNIGGIIFHIDEDAYDKLNIYLDTLKHYFHTTTEDKEIVDDIEARIAELMQPRITEAKQSISIEDIKEIIGILGKPEDIAGDSEPSGEQRSSETHQEFTENKKGMRRLYRDVDNAVIGGVCSGLGAYFNIDPVLFRIVFIALIFAGGISLIIYPVLWIAVPAAITAAQKLEMRGKNVNISNIERQVRDEYARVKDKFSNIDTRPYTNKISNFFHELFGALGSFLRVFGVFIKIIFAIALIGFALALLIGFIAGFYFGSFAIDEPLLGSFNTVYELLTAIVNPFTANIFIILALLIVILPCVALIYWGLKLLIRFHAKDKLVSVALTIIWLGAVITFLGLLFAQFRNFRFESSANEIVHLQKPSKNLLYINAVGVAKEKEENRYTMYDEGLFGIDKSSDKFQVISPVTIYIEKAKGTEPYIEIVKKGRGLSYEDASQSLKSVFVYTSQSDTVLSIDPFFRLRDGELWKFNRTKMIFYIPEGMNIRFSPEIEPFVSDFRDRFWNYNDLSSENWLMTSTGIDINRQKIVEGHVLKGIGNKTLYIKVSDKYPVTESELAEKNNTTRTVTYKRRGHNYTVTYDGSDENINRISFNGKDYKYGVINFEIEKSNDSETRVDVIKTVSGTSPGKAERFANKIEYGFTQTDSVLMLDPIYLVPENENLKKHKITVKIYIPKEKKFYLDNQLNPLYNNDYWLGKQLKMGSDGYFQTIY